MLNRLTHCDMTHSYVTHIGAAANVEPTDSL